MKKIFALLILFLGFPSLTAFAASEMCTSKSFTIRNWKGTVETDPTLALSTPASTTPAFTDEVEQEEPVMDDHGGEETDEVETGEHSEQPIPPAFTDVVEMDGQPATPIFTSSTDEVEEDGQDEQGEPGEQGEFVGEVEGQGEQPVYDHSGMIEEASSESAESEQGEEMEPEGEEQPIP